MKTTFLFLITGALILAFTPMVSASTITACVNAQGSVRILLTSGDTCKSSETQVTWPDTATPATVLPKAVDSVGTVLGDVLERNFFTFHPDVNTLVYVPYTINGYGNSGIAANQIFFFTTADCSGTTYMPLGSGGELFGYWDNSQLVYPIMATIGSRTVYSYRLPGGSCTAYNNTIIIGEAIGASLPAIVPPITVR